ncbi:lipoprotein-releasing ABC transporter permease subunit [Alteromonadaceae bacterium BrNp21-10]|nr:lipoprotein-releasing ABC transporter permease subunit [Alteromonadaceae bacterium BrNp21-10]
MFHSAFMFIGLRYARASKTSHFIAFINFFSVMGIAVGITALITVSSVMNGFEGQLKQRILGIVPHLLIAPSVANESSEKSAEEFQANFFAQLQQLPHVMGHAQQIEQEGLVQGARGLKGVLIQGVDADAMQRYSEIASHMRMGLLADLSSRSYNIVIGLALARELDVQVGDEIRLMIAGATMYTPFGAMPSQRKFTISGIFDLSSELDAKVVLVNIDDAARLMRQRSGDIAQTRVFLDDAFAYQQVMQNIQQFTDAKIIDWRQRQGPLFDAVKMEKNMMSLMLLLIVAVAAFNIVSALVMVVSEKRGDIAILRTQGMTTSHITGIFLVNGLYNGVKGVAWGLVGGVLLATQLDAIIQLIGLRFLPGPAGAGLPVLIEWQQVMSIGLLSLLLTFLATLYPAYSAAKVAPADALRYE